MTDKKKDEITKHLRAFPSHKENGFSGCQIVSFKEKVIETYEEYSKLHNREDVKFSIYDTGWCAFVFWNYAEVHVFTDYEDKEDFRQFCYPKQTE